MIYGGALNNGFVLDDEDHIVNNAMVHEIGSFRDFFSGSTVNAAGSGRLGGIYYKPLMTLSYSALWTLFGSGPFSFHLYQLILHILNSVLLFVFLRSFLQPSRPEGIFNAFAFFAAALFLIHPLNTEAVVYIACLQDILYLFFGMLALTYFAKSDQVSWKKSALTALILLCALLSKETGLLFFIMIAVYAALFRRAALWKVVFFEGAALAVYLWLRLGVAHLNIAHESITQISQASALTRLTTAPLALAMYLWQFVWPMHLTITQDWIVTSPLTLDSFYLPLITLVVSFGFSLWYWLRSRDQVFLFFFLWSIIGFGLHSQILVPLDGVFADRWFYFPGLGVIGMLATFCIRRWPDSRALRAIFLIVLVPMAIRSYVRSADWQDPFTLYSHDIEFLPGSYDLQNNLGVELFRRGRLSDAKTHFEISTQLAPHWTVNWNNLGSVHWSTGDLDRAEKDYLRSMENGTYHMAFENYVSLLLKENRRPEAKAFLENKALVLFPENPVLRQSLSKANAP